MLYLNLYICLILFMLPLIYYFEHTCSREIYVSVNANVKIRCVVGRLEAKFISLPFRFANEQSELFLMAVLNISVLILRPGDV